MTVDSASGGKSETAAVRLTQQVKAGGCASKLAPGTLSAVLGRLPRQVNPNLLVGFETADDAGVYRLSATEALVQTVDFFTPMVDDPFTYGRIAATNALSDVYAMGGRAVTALSLVCFPQDGDPDVLEQIMRGGLSVMEEAGCVVLGGHSVRDNEIKFGYAVTGLVHPDRVLKNTGAQAGDALVFTKAVGTGVITTALKQGKAEAVWVDAAIASMTTLNRRAAEIAVQPGFGVHAMTDVTGFGLMGHGRELAFGSGVRLVIDANAVQVLPGALESIALGCVPAGLLANRDYAGCVVEETEGSAVRDGLRTVLYDPQTAGGLLMSADAAQAEALVAELRAAGYAAAGVIGNVVAGSPKILLRCG
ncbi:MAG TPA: selenide, water dikinase SelD [Acidobacteriaceae bacterium]|nr:selenide, water dikinase SelD [Acidobacteriaceae bacterium]